jgi:hypothetical protein
MTLEDAQKLADVLSMADDHIVIGEMLDDLNLAFPEFHFRMTCFEIPPYSKVFVVTKPREEDA